MIPEASIVGLADVLPLPHPTFQALYEAHFRLQCWQSSWSVNQGALLVSLSPEILNLEQKNSKRERQN